MGKWKTLARELRDQRMEYLLSRMDDSKGAMADACSGFIREMLARPPHPNHLSQVLPTKAEMQRMRSVISVPRFVGKMPMRRLYPVLPKEKHVTIYRYTFIDADDTEQEYTTLNKGKAKAYAQEHELAIVEQTYTFDDSELVSEWDYRPEKSEEEGEPL